MRIEIRKKPYHCKHREPLKRTIFALPGTVLSRMTDSRTFETVTIKHCTFGTILVKYNALKRLHFLTILIDFKFQNKGMDIQVRIYV